jgi:hypothetical protein
MSVTCSNKYICDCDNLDSIVSMDSTSSTTQPSRSQSPSTPEPFAALDSISIRSELDLTSWYLSGMHTINDNALPLVVSDLPQHKTEDDRMLRLDELIEDHAYEEYVFTSLSKPIS